VSVVKLGWLNLHRIEKAAIFIAIILAVISGYQFTVSGGEIISLHVLVPQILMAMILYSVFLVGVIRGRSRAMNSMFVELMKELRDTKIRHGENMDILNTDSMIAEFLGDNR